MSREIPWVYAEEIDWNVGDVWLVELKDEVCAAELATQWQVVQVQEWFTKPKKTSIHLCSIDGLDQFAPVANVWRGLCLEKSETA